MEPCNHLFRHARLATLVEGPAAYGLIPSGSLAIRDRRIAWVGPDSELPSDLEAERVTDCEGRLLTPGLIDCHTHLIWGGDRIRELEQRLQGVSYQEIARRGGGINSTVAATREADDDTLLRAAGSRLANLMAEGVTRVEIKSGYGLDTVNELKILRLARRLDGDLPIRVHPTFLGAHAVPPEYAGRGDDYLQLVIEEMLPAVVAEGLATAVDAFLESIAFSAEQVNRLFAAARRHGLPVKLHAEQLSCLGGAALAARYRALSADHLEYLDEAGVRSMASAGTVAVLLPGAFYYLRETRVPPVAALRRHGVPIALATDLNPGSSPVHSLLAILNLGCLLFGLTPEEALAGVTREAARALGVAAEAGTLEVGKRADLALWDVETPAALAANLGLNPCTGRFIDGREVTWTRSIQRSS